VGEAEACVRVGLGTGAPDESSSGDGAEDKEKAGVGTAISAVAEVESGMEPGVGV